MDAEKADLPQDGDWVEVFRLMNELDKAVRELRMEQSERDRLRAELARLKAKQEGG